MTTIIVHYTIETNFKANCDIDELPEGRFTLSIYIILTNVVNLVYMPNSSARISNWFTSGGRNLFNL